jgi:hypothetical protein
LVIGRLLVDGEHEFPVAHRLQDQFKVRTLSDWTARQGSPALLFDPQCDPAAALDARRFIAEVNRALHENPPPASDAPLLARYRQVGIGGDCPQTASPGRSPCSSARSRKACACCRQAMPGGRAPRLDASGAARGRLRHGPHAAGGDRAQVHRRAGERREAIYPMAWHDGQMRPLTGEHAYRLHFPADAPARGRRLLVAHDVRPA